MIFVWDENCSKINKDWFRKKICPLGPIKFVYFILSQDILRDTVIEKRNMNNVFSIVVYRVVRYRVR